MAFIATRARAAVCRVATRAAHARAMATLHFTKDHEWVSVDGDSAVIGITQYAQDQMGDVVHVSLPDVGDELSVGDTLASIESVKAASDVYVPVDCVVNEVNGELDGNPGLVNESPEADGWFAKVSVKDASALADMMDEAAYRAFCEQH
ncbi:hypothetical protein FNF27_03220 [Cafeteria roenbergensis]|uniref:Glycine cleavage system H protein n=1 Tax=Cafeteria roenbergensis TaxID=33653 RepID=A0A5A8DZA2_CAFRO|nr:hypothetical protein FNF29_04312 [Cafeteria roenbergensis]KAA0164715.1 hypothetical protein FNF31_02253 [Cafeteria roenbergensis]KAA0169140.1 hypothetical protein FNF28_02266 [Cafeteria roenbergensis]KAA0175212.1 hypothetical protein FNF27_03220 [Cafeteria roenbergensis]|eukprot:KAA0151906.1 hypothetical protein FNF29_04312 [Cafeteria roenbergensis]